ncbi:MAG: hypothetical protein ACYC9O_04190 [Candidatus Latescibacterota bacterium]
MRIGFFSLLVITVLSAILPCAGATNDVDLDGNGKPDRIIFEGKPDGNTFTIIVNGVRHEGKGNYISGRYEIVDIDSTDGLREIAVPEWGPSDDYATTFLLYRQGKIREIGKIPGAGNMMRVDGSGMIHTMVRGQVLHTWFYPAAFTLDEKHTLHMVEQPLYPMFTPKGGFTGFSQGTECTAKRSFPLRASPTDLTIVRTLVPGEKFTIVA